MMNTLRQTYENVSIATVTRYIIMTMALTMIFLAQGDIAMAARVSTEFHVGLQPMGLIMAAGVVVSIISHNRFWRIIGCVPYILFLVGVIIVAFKQSISFHIILVYAGYALQMILSIRNGDNNHVAAKS